MMLHVMTHKPLVVLYTSNRYDEALARVRGHQGAVVAVTSNLAKVMGLKVDKPDKQRGLFDGDM